MSLYNAVALAERADVTHRQINHWTRKGYLIPVPITGDAADAIRLFREDDIIRARLLGLLLDESMASTLASELATNGTCRLREFTFALNDITTNGSLIVTTPTAEENQ